MTTKIRKIEKVPYIPTDVVYEIATYLKVQELYPYIFYICKEWHAIKENILQSKVFLWRLLEKTDWGKIIPEKIKIRTTRP